MKAGVTALWRLLRLNIRCLLLQASWNYRQFQGLGWCFVLLPELRRLYPQRTAQELVADYLKYFNTNTFLAPALAAATVTLEEQRAANDAAPIAAPAFCSAVMAPFAAVGDALFWGGWRPLSACVAVVLGWCGYQWAPLLMLALFNVPAVVTRLGGAWLGWRLGAQLVDLPRRWRLADIAVVLKHIVVVALAVLCALMVHRQELPVVPLVAAALMLPLLLAVLVWSLRRGVPVIVALTLLLGLVLATDSLFFI